VPVLRELLAEKDALLDVTVPKALGKIATPEAIALLSECLLLPDHWGAVEAAFRGLEASRSKEAVQSLISALRTPGPAREFCGQVGHAIGVLKGASSLVQFAQEAGMRGDEHSRFATVCALCNCGQQDSDIEEILLTAANDPEPRIRREAVRGLARTKSPRAEERLLAICLADVDQGVREEASEALRHFPGEAGIPKLLTRLENAEDEIRIHAAEALARIQDDRAIPALLKLLESNHALTRIAAAKALDALGFNQVETLIQVLFLLARTAPDIKVRQEAAKALREIPGGEDRLYHPIREALIGGRFEEVTQLIGSDKPFLPDDSNLYWWRGLARYSLKRYQDALLDLDQAIFLADCDAKVHRTRSEVLADLNRLPEALGAAEKAAGIAPEEADNHFLVGWWAYRANELEKSITASRRALELNPKQPMAEFNLGLALLASGQSPEDIDAYSRGMVLCADLDQETALATLDGASGDLDALILERPQLTARAEESKSRLKRAREARLPPSQ
jgi:HEAT repeat protein